MAIFKLLLILALIVYGIKRKFFVGYLLCLAGIATPLLFGNSPIEVLDGIWGTAKSPVFWRIFEAIAIVTSLGQILKINGSLNRLTNAAQGLTGGKRTATAILPAAIGLLPMPGGALLSAPLVEEVLRKDDKPPQFMAASNYWFRHVMEFFWPLYPGIILGAAITGMKIQQFSFLGIIMSLIMITIGYLFFLRKITNHSQPNHNFKSIFGISMAIWPLFLAVVLALGAELDIVIALAISFVVVLIGSRTSRRSIWPVVKRSITIKLFFMVFGILVFKDMLELSGAVADIPVEVARFGIRPAAIIFIVAFLSGLMSGMVAAFVGLSFPILSGFLYLPEINFGNVFLAYLSGYLGMILSPTHFCLLLTTEYFKAELGRVYREFLPPLIVLALSGLAIYLSGYPWGWFGN